jgi:hypothetical protein
VFSVLVVVFLCICPAIGFGLLGLACRRKSSWLLLAGLIVIVIAIFSVML